MRELNQLLFETVKDDSTYQTKTGATSTDPRFYKDHPPVKNPITNTKTAYGVYRHQGAIKPGIYVDGLERNEHVYTLEIFAKKSTIRDEICDFIELLFDDKQFQTTNYDVKYTSATEGAVGFNEELKLFTKTMTVHFRKVFKRNP